MEVFFAATNSLAALSCLQCFDKRRSRSHDDERDVGRHSRRRMRRSRELDDEQQAPVPDAPLIDLVADPLLSRGVGGHHAQSLRGGFPTQPPFVYSYAWPASSHYAVHHHHAPAEVGMTLTESITRAYTAHHVVPVAPDAAVMSTVWPGAHAQPHPWTHPTHVAAALAHGGHAAPHAAHYMYPHAHPSAPPMVAAHYYADARRHAEVLAHEQAAAAAAVASDDDELDDSVNNRNVAWVDYLPSFNAVGETGDENCAICLGPLHEERVSTGQCLHILHTTCLKQWLVRDRLVACPVCRVPYRNGDWMKSLDDSPRCPVPHVRVSPSSMTNLA